MDTTKAAELIDKSEYVGLLLPQEPSLDCLLAGEVLTKILEDKKKKVGILGTLKNGHETAGPSLHTRLANNPELPQEFIISLNTKTSPVSQLRYEKGEENLEIILSPQRISLSPQDVSFRNGKTLCDCVISLGVEDLESLNDPLRVEPQILTETPVVNIDSSLDNKNYGEANLVKNCPIAEIVYGLFQALERRPPEPEEATLLIAGILNKTEGLSSKNLHPDTLLALSELMRAGGDYEKAMEISRSGKPISLLQLIGRATVRSKMDHNTGVFWSFLTPEDFEKTGRTNQDIPYVIKTLQKEFSPKRLLTLLWQGPESGLVYTTVTGDESVVSALYDRVGGTFQSPYLLLSTSFADFREAEDSITLLLSEVL